MPREVTGERTGYQVGGTIASTRIAGLAAHWPLLVAGVVGFATAFYRLGYKGLWGDEVWQVAWSHQETLGGTFSRFTTPPDLPLHFMLVQLATSWSQDPFWTRLPSAVLGAVTVPALYLLGRRVAGPATGLLGALFLAVAPYHVWYAQDARPCAALTCYAVLSVYALVLLIERPSLVATLCYAAAATAGIYNHLFGVLPLLVNLVAALALAARTWWRSTLGQAPKAIRRQDAHLGEPGAQATSQRRARRTLACVAGGTAIALLAAIPLLPGIAGYLGNHGPGDGGAAAFRLDGPVLAGLPAIFGSGRGWPLTITAALFLAGTVAGLYRRRWFAPFTLGWLVLPLAVLWIAHPHHQFIPRYVLFMQPLYLLQAAGGVVALGEVVVAAGVRYVPSLGRHRYSVSGVVVLLALGIGAMTVTPTVLAYSVEKANDWSGICAYLQRHARPGDVVTGNAYTQGLMDWCFVDRNAISVAPAGSYSAASLAAGGRDVWYVMIGDDPQAATIRQRYQRVPRTAWARPGLQVLTEDGDRLIFPQAEFPAVVYHYRSGPPPSRLMFHDVHGARFNPAWPDYAQLGPGGTATVRLALPARQPRVLRIVLFALVKRDLDVFVDGRLLRHLRSRRRGALWMAVTMALPPHVPDSMTIDLRAVGSDVAAYSSLEVRYAGRT